MRKSNRALYSHTDAAVFLWFDDLGPATVICVLRALAHKLKVASMDIKKRCSATVYWLRQGLRGVALQTSIGVNHESKNSDIAFDAVSQRFLRAVVFGQYENALELTAQLHSEDRLRLILVTCEKLETDWLDKTLSLSDAAQGFWTTQRIFKRLRDSAHGPDYIGVTSRNCLFWVQPDDLHTYGAQFLVEVFERAGWSADLMLNTTPETVISHLSSKKTDVLGVSIGCDEFFLRVADFLTEARIRSLNPNVTTMIGGAAIEGNLSQYGFLGADVLANDAESALMQVNDKSDA